MSSSLAPLVDNSVSRGDPVDVAERFLDLPYPLFLDSATGAAPAAEVHPLGRYSFFAADPAIVIRSKGRGYRGRRPGTAPDPV